MEQLLISCGMIGVHQVFRKVFINHDSDLIDVTLTVDPGTKATTKVGQGPASNSKSRWPVMAAMLHPSAAQKPFTPPRTIPG